MNFFESKFTPVMYKALQSQIKDFVKVMREKGVDVAKRELDQVVVNGEVFEAVKRIYKTVGIFFANETYKNIIDQVPQKGFGFNPEWIQEILRYFNMYLLSKAVLPISETTRERIRQILEEGEKEGWGVDQMARQMLADDMTLYRARMITRTETAKAAFKGREMGKDKSPYALTSQWIAARDHRTRHSHREMNQVTVDEGQQFLVPVYRDRIQIGTELMIGPGDPKASKGNVINCRCTTAERVKFDENDNPIMRKRVAV